MNIGANGDKKILEFESSVPPSVNHYNNFRVVSKGRKNIIMSYPSEEYTKFKKEFGPYIKKLAKEEKWDLEPTGSKHYYLDVVMYFARRDKDSQNYFKCPSDVGNGILWIDDKMLITRAMRVYYTNNPDVPPHFEYTLYEVPYIGIFDSQEEYEGFISKCDSCRNYKDGSCKRLEEYMSYKITKDFDWNTRQCLGYKEKKKVG